MIMTQKDYLTKQYGMWGKSHGWSNAPVVFLPIYTEFCKNIKYGNVECQILKTSQGIRYSFFVGEYIIEDYNGHGLSVPEINFIKATQEILEKAKQEDLEWGSAPEDNSGIGLAVFAFVVAVAMVIIGAAGIICNL